MGQREAILGDDKAGPKFQALPRGGGVGYKIKWPTAASFLPRSAVCNLENLPVASNCPCHPKMAAAGPGFEFGAV